MIGHIIVTDSFMWMYHLMALIVFTILTILGVVFISRSANDIDKRPFMSALILVIGVAMAAAGLYASTNYTLTEIIRLWPS